MNIRKKYEELVKSTICKDDTKIIFSEKSVEIINKLAKSSCRTFFYKHALMKPDVFKALTYLQEKKSSVEIYCLLNKLLTDCENNNQRKQGILLLTPTLDKKIKQERDAQATEWRKEMIINFEN